GEGHHIVPQGLLVRSASAVSRTRTGEQYEEPTLGRRREGQATSRTTAVDPTYRSREELAPAQLQEQSVVDLLYKGCGEQRADTSTRTVKATDEVEATIDHKSASVSTSAAHGRPASGYDGPAG
ncbi:unnamed protein product, partial [Amoebophrya sp. A120]